MVKGQGYSQGQSDHTLFMKFANNGMVAILIVYVDNIVVTGDFKEEILRVRDVLSREFKIKDFGNLKYFLGNQRKAQ